MNYDRLVQNRVGAQDHYDKYRKITHAMRRLVAGDLSLFGYTSPQEAEKSKDEAGLAGLNWSDFLTDHLYDIMVTDVSEGLSNQMWRTIKTLTMQVAFKMPTIEFEDLSAEEAAMNQAYLNVICGHAPRGCGAVFQHRKSLVDYMIGGIGATMVTFRKGRPAIEYVDPLDLTWDTSAKLLSDMRWVSRKVRQPLYIWVDMFGRDAMSNYLDGVTSDDDETDIMDTHVELEWYYDITGNDGRGLHYVLDCLRPDLEDAGSRFTILDKSENPFYCDIDGIDPFLPVNFLYFMEVPSVRFPMAPVFTMLPHQVAIWKMEKNFNAVIDRGRSQHAYEEGSFADDKAAEDWAKGITAGTIKLKKGARKPETVEGLKLSDEDVAYYQYHAKELNAQGGADPYSGGGRVEGVNFSSEVSAITSASQLTASNAAKDHADHWARSASMLLKAAKTYDTKPITLRLDEVTLPFNDSMPISMFLRPDGDVVVKENSTLFRTRDSRLSEAMALVTLGKELEPRGYQTWLDNALSGLLRAVGEKNIAGWLERTPLMPGMGEGMPGMGAGGLDASAVAQAATA